MLPVFILLADSIRFICKIFTTMREHLEAMLELLKVIITSLWYKDFILSYTHACTYVGFYGLRGLSIGVMVFILYKLYVVLPYTYPTPKLSPHRRRCISTFPPKNSLCMIYKRFKLRGHWKRPHKSPSPCNTCHTHVIIQICVLINHINMPPHTHTHKKTHTKTHTQKHTHKNTAQVK